MLCHACVPLVVSCSQSRHYHFLWPTMKMEGIFLLTWYHNRVGKDGIFLVATLALGCSICAPYFASLSACSFPGTPHWTVSMKGHSVVVA